MRLVCALAFCSVALAGCPNPMEMMGDPGPKELPDGFVKGGCFQKSDCDDGDPCTDDICQQNHECSYTTRDCSEKADACNKGVCDPDDGTCKAEPANDGMACMSGTTGDPGKCMTGICSPIPQCELSWTTLSCASFDASTPDSTSGTSALSDYSCAGASGLTGPENAYPFSVTTDRDVTLTLKNATVDFDLLVLEGQYCISSAACAAKSITAGTGNETLTFKAKGGIDYVIVVDGRNGVSGSYTLEISCVGGTCKNIKNLSCNQSVMGNTTGTNATNIVSTYACATMMNGPEDTYRVTQTSDTNYKTKLSGLTTDLDMIITLESGGECDPTWCKASAIQTGTTNEEVSWTGYSSSVYDIHIDSKSVGGPYLLEVACPPSCANTSNTISCSTGSVNGRNDDGTKSKDLVDSWGTCATNTTGNEVVYRFSPSTTGMYTFELTGLTADLDLIVMSGDYSTCDPTNACVAASVNSGTTAETVTFLADSLKYYWIAVDGKNNAAGNYTLKIKSALCPGASCYNSANELSCSYLEDTRRNDDMARSKMVVDGWACDANTTGPEVVYKFTPATSGMYTVTLDGLSADLDLVVVSNTSAFSCDANAACVASSVKTGTQNESVTFQANTGTTYYIGVDGKNGAVGTYHVKLASASCGAATCKNGFDSLSCTTKSTTNRNDASGATNNITFWSMCAGTPSPGGNGPEFAHAFTPSGAGPYTVRMIGLAADLDLVVLETTSTSSCAPNYKCMGSSKNTGTADEQVTFTADPAKYYWFIADGKAGATSSYTLAITSGCP